MCQVANTLIGNWDRSMGGGANNSSPLAQYCAELGIAHRYSAISLVLPMVSNPLLLQLPELQHLLQGHRAVGHLLRH